MASRGQYGWRRWWEREIFDGRGGNGLVGWAVSVQTGGFGFGWAVSAVANVEVDDGGVTARVWMDAHGWYARAEVWEA